MISNNIEILIEKLITKTKAGQAFWDKTSRDSEFKLELQKGAITSDSWSDGNGVFVDLAILNDEGEIIERDFFDLHENQEDYSKLYDVNMAAKNSYYKLDETLKTIFDELDSVKPVGKNRNKDLPF